MSIAQINYKLQEQITKFSGKLSDGMNKTVHRFIYQTIYGILKKQSVKISEIARSLNEEIPLIKTENRLCRQINREGLDKKIMNSIISESLNRINKNTLIILDLSDIRKNYAEKMEYLSEVRDGSSGEIADGYSLLELIGFNKNIGELIPLYSELYSTKSPDFIGENDKILKALDFLINSLNTRNTYVIDRGGDREIIFKYLINNNQGFIIRLVGNRKVICNGEEYIVEDLIKNGRILYRESIMKSGKGENKIIPISYRYFKVQLPNIKKNLYLLSIEGFGEKPLILLTTIKLRKKLKILRMVFELYICRWKIEETIRFMKQSYNLEDIRLLKYRSLRNMVAIVLAVTYFVAVSLAFNVRLNVLTMYAMESSKLLFGIPDFKYYTITNGIQEILGRFYKTLFLKNIKKEDETQLKLL